MKPLNKGSRLFTMTSAVFVTAASLSYILIDFAGVNYPRYYPELRLFSLEPIVDEISMGFYGRFMYGLIAGAIIAIIYAFISPVLKRWRLTRMSHMTVVTTVVLWFSSAIIILEEWHKWGIEKRDLDNAEIYNSEFWLFVIGILVFFGGLMLTTAAIRRVTSSDPKTLKKEREALNNVK